MPNDGHGYGYLILSDNYRNKFTVTPDRNHRVRFVAGAQGEFTIWCSKPGCRFRRKKIAGLAHAERLARKHLANPSVR